MAGIISRWGSAKYYPRYNEAVCQQPAPLAFQGKSIRAFVVKSGVKQGCPLSATLFVLALDPFLRAMASRIGPCNVCRAYADDIALVLYHIWPYFKIVNELFHEFCTMSNLKVKVAKCIILPLWSIRHARLRELLLERAPGWGAYVIADHGKYLGFMIGPGSKQHWWEAPTDKYTARCAQVAAVGWGALDTCRLYNTRALTTLQYTAQLREPSPELIALEAHMIDMMTKGPYRWMPIPAAHSMDVMFHFPAHYRSLECTALASRGRVAVSMEPLWRRDCARIDTAIRQADSSTTLAWLRWPEDSAAADLRRTHADLLSERSLPPDTRGEADRDHAQTTIYHNIRQYQQHDLLPLLEARWERWQVHLGGLAGLKAAVRRAPAFLYSLAPIVPPCVQHAVISSWFNGWCTSRRFQQPVRKCNMHPD